MSLRLLLKQTLKNIINISKPNQEHFLQEFVNGAVVNAYDIIVKGFISPGNKNHWSTLYRFTKPGIKFNIMRNMTKLL